MIKACLFDLDGTLLNTLTTIAHFANFALAEHGIEPIDEKEYRFFAGNGARKLVERMLRFRGVYNEELFCRVYDCYMKAYDANPTHLSEPYEGICAMLTALKERGIKTGVISNKPDYAAKSVCAEKIDKGLVDFVQGQIDGVPVKPDITGPLQVLSALGVKRGETMYIGDSGVDMQTGKNLHSLTVGVSWGFRTEDELMENGADKIVNSPLQIVEIADESRK